MLQIPCDKCNGTGHRPLSTELATTLRAVQSGLQTTTEIYQSDPDRAVIGVVAINRRLERLLEAGFVSRRKGPKKFFIYSPTAKAGRLNPTTKKKEPHGRRTKRR